MKPAAASCAAHDRRHAGGSAERGHEVVDEAARLHENMVDAFLRWSMIRKKPAPDLIQGVKRFSEKAMLEQEAKAG